MSVGFGTYKGNGAPSGGSSLAITGVVSGQPILLWAAGTTMPSLSDTFSTSYAWTQAATVTSTVTSGGQLIVGTGGSGTSGTISGTGLVLAQSLTGASLASGTAIIDSSATSTSQSATASVTPATSGDAVLAFIVSYSAGIVFSGTIIADGNTILGYPVWLETGTTGVSTGTPVSYSFSTFGNPAWSIIVAVKAGVSATAQLVMLL